jgi:hypothetical protein
LQALELALLGVSANSKDASMSRFSSMDSQNEPQVTEKTKKMNVTAQRLSNPN